MVLPLRADSGIVPAVTAGLPTVALRMPAHPLALGLLRMLDLPLAAPSANRSMGVSPTTAAHVAGSLTEGLAAILDGGVCQQGLESTIVALREGGQWSLLREGPVTSAELSEVLGSPPVELTKGIEAPGQLVRHYSPGKPVRLGAAAAQEGEFLIGFGALAGQCNLSPTGEQWKPFTSRQRVITRRPGFLWDAKIAMLPGVTVRVVDSYVAGKGLLRAKVQGLVRAVCAATAPWPPRPPGAADRCAASARVPLTGPRSSSFCAHFGSCRPSSVGRSGSGGACRCRSGRPAPWL